MSCMTEEQVRLLHKLQMAGIPAFASVNPLTMGEDEADDYFRMNLPPLEWINAVGETKDHEYVEKHFIGVSENNCRTQMQEWLDREDLTLFQQPNPQFGSGVMWLEYFSQPLNSVNLKALENLFKKWEIQVPQIPLLTEGEKSKRFNALELAFDDCGEERINSFVEYRKTRDERSINKVTPEQRALIKALQAAGKGPKIDRDVYLSLKNKDAAAYIHENENNPENTFEATEYQQRSAAPKDEAFPEFKKSNLLSQKQADYLQRSIIRDLAAEGHIATPETLPELMDKLELITESQAKEMIEPHLKTPAGSGLLAQCKAYIDSGKIHNPGNIQTIADVHKLYQTHRGYNFDMKAALRDLIEGGYLQTNDGMAKIKFTTEMQDAALIAKYGGMPAGSNLRTRIYDLINDARIGNLDDEQFSKLSVRQAMQLISSNAEIEHFKNQSLATKGQKELLQKMEARGSLSLQKINMERLSFKAADQLIKQNLKNAPERTPAAPATSKQRTLIKVLVANQLVSSMPYDEWKNLTVQKASQLIASVPEEQRKSISSQSYGNSRNYSREPTAPER